MLMLFAQRWRSGQQTPRGRAMSNTTATTTPPGCQLLTIKDVSAMLKIHARTVWRLSALAEAGQGSFPKPLRLGEKTVRWRLADVEAYLDGLANKGALS
jgi:predicted DNA-binding transcriptional regulator AlpA